MVDATSHAARAISIVRRIDLMADFRHHTAIRQAAEQAVPVTMPRDVGALGFDVPLWMGLGIVGLWAALDAFHERVKPNRAKCATCRRQTCIAARFDPYAGPAELAILSELEDLRHLYAHNYAGEADDAFFVRPRHALLKNTLVTLKCGAIFDGKYINLEAVHLRFYARFAQRVLEQF